MVPRFTDFYIPVLHVMSDIEPIEINKLIDNVADYVQLTEMDKSVITEGGTQLKYRSNISWAITDLCQGNFIERIKRGHYVITINGLELLEEKPVKIDREYLAKCSNEFRDFLERRGTRKKNQITSERTFLYENRKSSNIQVKNDSRNNKKDTSESYTSLDELYKATETLRKANISTKELENKISELESNIVIKNLSESISKIIPDALIGINRKITLTIDYYPNEAICLKVGNRQRTIRLGKNYLNERVPKCIEESKNEDNIKHEYKIVNTSLSKSYSRNENDNITEKHKEISSGVWIKYHSDRTIIIDGDTDSFSHIFKSYGGIKISTTEGGTGWMFMRNKEEGLREDLKNFLITEPQACDKNISPDTRYKDTNKDKYSNQNSLPEVDIKISDGITKRYLEIFDKLRSFNFLGITGPHKAVLLLAIFKSINSGKYLENKIYYTDDLESSYNDCWNKYIGGTPTLGAVYPYIHLGRECFFIHKLEKPIRDYDKTWSRQKVGQYVQYAFIDKRLFELIKNETTYSTIKKYLITRYCTRNSKDVKTNKSIDNISETDFKENFITVESNLEKHISIDENLQDKFRDYLRLCGTRNGKSYTNSTICVYIGALNSLYLINIVCKFHSSGNIFNIRESKTLDKIKELVEQDCAEKIGSTLCRSALSLYCKFIRETYT